LVLGISALGILTVCIVAWHPTVMPLCFPHEVITAKGTVERGLNCPTRSHTTAATGGDVLIVALLGLLGGALAAAVSIRNLKGTGTPYDVPVALAMLKGPLGALTAIVGLVAIQGDFIPGLSVLDSQEQILAYALVLGFAQQVFTRLLDQRAQTLLSGLPSRDATTRPEPAARPSPTTDGGAVGGPTTPGGTGGTDGTDGTDGTADEAAAMDAADTELPETLPNPEGDEDDQIQDDETVEPLPDAPEQDHR
jgi:hypothetical protein